MALKFSLIEPFEVLFQGVTTTATPGVSPRVVDPLPTSYRVNATGTETLYTLPATPTNIMVNNVSLKNATWTAVASPALTDGKWSGTVTAQVYWSGTTLKTRLQLSGTATQAYTITQAQSKYLCDAGVEITTIKWIDSTGVEQDVKKVIYDNVIIFNKITLEDPILEINKANWGYQELCTYVTNNNNFAVTATGYHFVEAGADQTTKETISFTETVPANSKIALWWQPSSITNGKDYIITDCKFLYDDISSNTVTVSALFKLGGKLSAPIIETYTVSYTGTTSTWAVDLKVSNSNNTPVNLYVEIEDDTGSIVANGRYGTLLANEQNRIITIDELKFETGDIANVRAYFQQIDYEDSEVTETEILWSENS